MVSALLLAATRTEVGGLKWSALPPAWLLLLAAVALFLFARALYARERGRAGRATRVGLALLRTFILFLLLLVLAKPFREEVSSAEERSHLVLLVDTSASMGTADRYAPEEGDQLEAAAYPQGGAERVDGLLEAGRLDLVRRVLGAEGEPLLRELDRRFVLHVFAFDEDWRSLGSTRESAAGLARAESEQAEDPVAAIGKALAEAHPAGGSTRIGAVLRKVAGEFLGREDRRLAGVLLVTDGRDTSEREPPLDAIAALGQMRRDLHVTAVALGNPSSGQNVRVERVRAKDVVLLGDEVVIESAIRHEGFTGLDGVRGTLTVEKVADERGERIEPREVRPAGATALGLGPFRLGTEEEPTPLSFQVPFEEAGTFRVTVRAVLPPEAERSDAIKDDDSASQEIRVVDQRIKVLFVDNLPRYDWRFLSNYLTREPESDATRPGARRRYEAQVLLLSADPTVEQLASPGVRPLKAFPATRRELFEYHAIVFGDVDPSLLADTARETREITELIRDFVEEGGGIAFEAGEDYKNPLAFQGTALQDLLPINLRDIDRNASSKKDAYLRVGLTDVGTHFPVFGVVPGKDGPIASPEELRTIWSGAAPISRDWGWWWMYHATGGLRPGAVDLARVTSLDGPIDRSLFDQTGRPLVVFATMGFGKGRVFFSALDALSVLRRNQSDRIFGPFWDQVIRYLSTYRLLGGNNRFKISTDKDAYFVGETATVTITALDRDFEPVADPYLEGLRVESPLSGSRLLEGEDRPLNLVSEGAAPGTFRTYLPIRESGTYRLWISDSRERAAENRAERRFVAEFRAPELRQTIPNHDLLERITRETDGLLVDGRVARLYDLPEVAQTLPSRTVQRILSRKEQQQWDKPPVLILLVLLLGLEWYIRKRWQMV